MKIVKLEPLQNGGFRLCFDDGSSVKTTAVVVADLGVYSGMELDQKEAEKLLEYIAQTRTKQRAANMIGYRALSKKELVKKLKEKGESPQHAESAAEMLEELGYIDDAQYAKYLAARYSEKGYGKNRIKNELYARGVPREYWDEALEGLGDPADAIDAFLAKKLSPDSDQKEIKKVTDALIRKGFSWQDVKSGLYRFQNEE